jgi:hypothetical protein
VLKADIRGEPTLAPERKPMSLVDKIPLLDDAALKNLLDNAKRLGASGSPRQQADAAELLPALEAAMAARRATKLGAAAEKRAVNKKPAAAKGEKAAVAA